MRTLFFVLAATNSPLPETATDFPNSSGIAEESDVIQAPASHCIVFESQPKITSSPFSGVAAPPCVAPTAKTSPLDDMETE